MQSAARLPCGTEHCVTKEQKELGFFYGNGIGAANFHAGFATEAFFSVGRFRLAIFHFIDFHGAHVHAFATTNTLVLINIYVVSHESILQ